MSQRKFLCIAGFLMFMGFSAYGQIYGGIVGSTSFINPDIKTIGFAGFMDGRNNSNFYSGFKVGVSIGKMTMGYTEKDNSLKTVERSQESFYWDISGGYYGGWKFTKMFALRLGAELFFASAEAFEVPGSADSPYGNKFDFGLIVPAGLDFTFAENFMLLGEICPGISPVSGTFYLPLRFTAGIRF